METTRRWHLTPRGSFADAGPLHESMADRRHDKAPDPDSESELRRQLKREPNHHWVLTRLSSVLYEKHRYALALKYAENAFAQVPTCPLVLWDYAGALQMLGRHGEALDLYARIVTRGVRRIAIGECGEGKGWARGLVADAHYRASISLAALGKRKASLSAFDQCLDERGPGCYSIYRLDELSNPRLVATRPNQRIWTPPSSRKRRVKRSSKSSR
jgi:tetratricopeptide (TPR) repeat protein